MADRRKQLTYETAKELKLKILILILIFGVSITAQTVTSDNDSITLKADADADGTGKVDLQTRNIPRVTVENDGRVKIDVGLEFTDNVFNQAKPPLRFLGNDPATAGDYTFSRVNAPNQFAPSWDQRMLKDMVWGYNVSSPVPTESYMQIAMEKHYWTSQGVLQDEFWVGMGTPGFPGTRPFAIDHYLSNGTTQVSINTPSFIVSNPSQSNIWAQFVSRDTMGDLYLWNNSGINYGGTREFWISRAGIGIIGNTSKTQWNLFSGGMTNETANIFRYSSIANGAAPLTIKLGQDGGSLRIGSSSTSPLRWQVTGNYSGFSDIQTAYDVDVSATANKIIKRGPAGEVNVDSVQVGGVKVIGSRCTAIVNSDGTLADTVRAVNATLSCLRSHGLVAP